MIPTSNIIQNLRVESWRVEGAHNKDCWGNKKSHSGAFRETKRQSEAGLCVWEPGSQSEIKQRRTGPLFDALEHSPCWGNYLN